MRKQEIDYILTRMLDSYGNVSDLNITVGKPFQVETSGLLTGVDIDPPFQELTPFQSEVFALNLINQDRRLSQILLTEGSCDLSYELPGKARFRVNIFSQRGNYSVILRKLETKIPTCQELGLPQAFLKMAQEKNGIILVTGATGHGKTTTLAAMVDYINERRAHHILSLEDPIEFIHPLKKAVVNQRQLGSSTLSYHNALKGALRQDPDVIVIGELRDLDTISMAISAAETGHLVIGTLSTSNAAKTVERIINSYPPGEQNQIRTMLSESLKMVLTQRLIAGKDRKQMVLAVEILVGNLSVANQIRDNKTYQIPSTMQMGKKQGMQLMDDSVFTLYEAGRISPEAAVINLESQVLRKRIIAAAKGS